MNTIGRLFRRGRTDRKEVSFKVHEKSTVEIDRLDDDDDTDGSCTSIVSANGMSSRRTALDVSQDRNVAGLRSRVSQVGTSSRDSFYAFEANTKFNGLKQIHRGRFAVVYRAIDQQTGHARLVKVYSKIRLPRGQYQRVLQEIQFLTSNTFPSFPQLDSVWEDAQHVYVATDYFTGGTLLESMSRAGGRLGERHVGLEVAVPLLRMLVHLHGTGHVYRDLKPEHVLLHEGKVHLVDFLELAQPGTDSLNYRVGSLAYQAPEMLSKPTAADVFHQVLMFGMAEEDLPSYDDKVDVWSLGVLLYEALGGRQPFLADGVADMQQEHTRAFAAVDSIGCPLFLAGLPVSDSCRDFLQQVLCLDPALRPSAQALMRHPWIRECKDSAQPRHSGERRASERIASRRSSSFETRMKRTISDGDGADLAGVAQKVKTVYA